MRRRLIPWATILAAFLPPADRPAPAPPVPIGGVVEGLRFTDIRYLPRDLADFGPKRAYVLAFVTRDCPLVRRYLPELDRLERHYRGRGVQFAAIDVGPSDSIAEMAALAIEHGFEFPIVKDGDGSCARALGARRTPEVV